MCRLPELFESKKFVKNDMLYMNSYQLLIIFLLIDEPGKSKLINFYSIRIAVTLKSLYQKQHTHFKSIHFRSKTA